MGMSTADVTAMIAAWNANQDAWREKIVASGKFEWFLFYGGQQTANGWNQTDPAVTCLSFHRSNCGPSAPSQNGTMFFGFSRVTHQHAWYPNGTLPFGDQDIASFLISRGPYGYIGYGWTGCADATHPFTWPEKLDWDYGVPTDFCTEGTADVIDPVTGMSTAEVAGNGVFTRHWSKATIQMDCNTFTADIQML
jgi:hypothetical protein